MNTSLIVVLCAALPVLLVFRFNERKIKLFVKNINWNSRKARSALFASTFAAVLALAIVGHFLSSPPVSLACKLAREGLHKHKRDTSSDYLRNANAMALKNGMAVKYCMAAAEDGDIEAQLFVAEHYHQNGPSGEAEALKWYRKVALTWSIKAALGNHDAQCRLAYLFSHSMLTDYPPGAKWVLGNTVEGCQQVDIGELGYICPFWEDNDMAGCFY